ncbi:hypothetical protein N7517_006745 [Penicillium concentricum]|uniref:U1 small nuclear ribonucleoprotein C n=1 Tax=Penicillium concentricum TaxID=293559 RepID=A0A9W9VBM9_9EURO|nr:uncharacterized protein N7517_006745 [Penicillium concentricum]KAJ5374739.1 hypothetical protein N7517_006745 [Penicillium concentricum]
MFSWGRGRGRGRGRGQSRGRGGRASQISSSAPPLGDVIVTVHHNELETPADQDDTKSRITNSKYLTSYNWLGWERKISIPGEPPKWTPLSESNPPTLPQDKGGYYRDRNAAQYPTYPLEPMVQAILTDKPEFPVTSVDIIACNSTMGNLLRFVLGHDKPFRMLVEVLGNTVFFIRRENSPTEMIPDIYGYGHTFPEAYTTWGASVGGSESHQRVMQYEFAGMQCLIRFEADGFLPDLVPDNEETKQDPVSPGDDNLEEALSSMEKVRIICHPPVTTETAPKQLEIARRGRRIPQCAIFDLKTRSLNKKRHNTLEEELPRLWVSQTPNFVLAHHTSGRFRHIQVQDVRDDVKQWEEIQQPALGKFASLLQMIVAFARSAEDGKLEIEREEGDYCDVYLTHDSMSVRKAHNSGRNHLRNVVDYYQQIGQEKAQSVIDSITSSYAAEGQQAPNMMPPGAFPPPFGFPGTTLPYTPETQLKPKLTPPGHPGMPGMPPPPFGIPPPGAPGAPGMLPRMFYPVPTPPRKNRNHRRGSKPYPGQYQANQYPFHPAPGAHGLPFPPPFSNAGTPPTGGFPLPSPTCPKAQTCRSHPQEASPTSPSPRQARASRLCLCMASPVWVSPVWGLVVRRPFLLAPVA